MGKEAIRSGVRGLGMGWAPSFGVLSSASYFAKPLWILESFGLGRKSRWLYQSV